MVAMRTAFLLGIPPSGGIRFVARGPDLARNKATTPPGPPEAGQAVPSKKIPGAVNTLAIHTAETGRGLSVNCALIARLSVCAPETAELYGQVSISRYTRP